MRSLVEKEKRSGWPGKLVRSSGSTALRVQHLFSLEKNSRGHFQELPLHPPNSKPKHLQLFITALRILFLNNSWFVTFFFLLSSSNLIVL